MPLPVIAGTFRIALLWGTNSRPDAVNVIHMRASTATPSTLFGALNATVAPGMWNWVSDQLKISRVVITKLDGATSSVEVATDLSAKWSGQGSGEPIPQVAGLVKITTGIRGRSARGRVFLPFVAENRQNNGTMLTGDVVTTAWEAFRTGFDTGDDGLGVVSEKLGVFYKAESCAAEARSATQRRRQRR